MGDPQPQPIHDRVSDDAPGAREIGFSVAQRYNSSAILFDNLQRGNGGRIALRGPAGDVTYDALCGLAARAGNALLSLGLMRGERVLLLLDDTPLYPAFLFGAIRAGLVPVLLNTLSPPDLLQFYLADAGARAIVIEADIVGQLAPEAVRGTRLETAIIANGEAALAHVERVLPSSWIETFPDTLTPADTRRDDMAFWMYSSGSTGRPKGVVHLQHDMAYTVQSYAKHILKLKPGDICYSVPKIFFAYGHGNSLTFPFAAGASSVLTPGKPEPGAIFEAIRRFRPTVFFGLPTLYTALAKAPQAKTADLSSLRLCISAAEILSNEVAAAWKALCNLDIVEGLGSTEMLHIYLSNTEAAKRPGSAGRRVPGYEIRLIDRDGKDVALGEEGIMCVRGHSSAPAYWNRPDKTAETMRGDWLYTGDRFVCDGDGFYFFRGRADDLIKVSGQWVYPLEVELCLAEHKAVREVAVLGLEMADRRMTLKAFVVPLDPAVERDALTRELQDFVKRALLPYKYPRVVEYLTELPKTGTGKIDRQALLRRAAGA
jgi:benzoate-CoA ligase family protein